MSKFRFVNVCFLLLLSTYVSRAQRSLTWLPDATLHLSGALPYDHVAVVDLRPDKSSIGYLKTGALDRYGEHNMADSLSRSLAAYATGIIRSAETVPGELLLVLRDFFIADKKGMEEIGTVHLRTDLFRTSESGYIFLRSLDTLYETKSGWDVTKGVQEMASQSIFNLLAFTREIAASSGANETKIFTRDEAIMHDETVKKVWAVYQTDSPQRGIYHSFDDFLALRASDTDFIEYRVAALDQPSFISFYHKNARGKKGDKIDNDECFAVYDGKRWYISRRGGFSPLTKEGREFYATLSQKGLTDNSAMMGLMFGVVGSVIASSDKSKHYTTYRTRLDPEAGRFMPIRRGR